MKTGAAGGSHRGLGAPAPTIVAGRRRPAPTAVFDSFWHFAAERQAIFFRRLAGEAGPWTDDPVLLAYKFTNAYRASDRTSQFLIRHVIYEGDKSAREVFFRTILFKMFNRIDTWRTLLAATGAVAADAFDVDRYQRILDDARQSGNRVYSAAYIMPPVSGASSTSKHAGHLALLLTMLQDSLPERIADAASLRSVYEQLLAYPSLGRFLAFQFAIDLNYGPMLRFDEADFVVAGPGAREGLAKCFTRRDDWSDEDLIAWTTDRQETEFASRGIRFQDLFGRPLKPIDIQNLFCEIAKYARVAHPGVGPAGSRTRIKQRFLPLGPLEPVWYPPKWGLVTTS